VLARDGGDAGPASARAYAWNTLGSIAGSIAAGFLLIPELGFEGTLGFCAAANLAIAAAASGLLEPRRPVLLAAAAAGAAALALFPPSTPWGVLRATSMGVGARAFGKVAYYGVGRSSTVLVTEQRFGFSLRTNGLPESVIPRRGAWHDRAPTVRWLTALPVMARPETRSMLVVGFGGGMLLELVPPTVERIDVIELEPEVIESNRRIAAERWRDPLADPRIHVHLNDARNALLLANTRFDAIVSQPSHPWAGGAAHLYTQEFFELVASRLSPDGVFVQWIGLPFVDEELLGSLLAALSQVFEHVQAYDPPPGGSMLFLCSNRPFDMPRSVARALARAGDDLGLIGITAPEDVLASLKLDDEGVRALAAGASSNRDDHNRLQSRSARLGEDSLAHRSDLYLAPYDPLVKSLPEDVDVFYLLRRLDPPERVARVAAELADPVDRQVGEALALISEGKPVGARRALEEALEAAPRHAEARAALLRLSTSQLVRGRDPAEVVAPPLLEQERLVVRAWMARAEDPSGAALLALDDELARIPLQHPLGSDAARLRALARLQSGEPARIDEAVRIVEETLGDRPDPRSLLVRAEVYAKAGEHALVLEALDSFARRLANGPQGAWRQPLLRRARDLAREVPDDDPELYWMRRRVLGQLGGGSWRG
jgi:tetratricopeptide (TPR) repeat protein